MPTDVRRKYLGYRLAKLLSNPFVLAISAIALYIAWDNLPPLTDLIGPSTFANLLILFIPYAIVVILARALLRGSLRRTADAQIAAHSAAVGGAASASAWFYMLSADINAGGGWMGGGLGANDHFGGGGFDGGGFDGGGGGGGE